MSSVSKQSLDDKLSEINKRHSLLLQNINERSPEEDGFLSLLFREPTQSITSPSSTG